MDLGKLRILLIFSCLQCGESRKNSISEIPSSGFINAKPASLVPPIQPIPQSSSEHGISPSSLSSQIRPPIAKIPSITDEAAPTYYSENAGVDSVAEVLMLAGKVHLLNNSIIEQIRDSSVAKAHFSPAEEELCMQIAALELEPFLNWLQANEAPSYSLLDEQEKKQRIEFFRILYPIYADPLQLSLIRKNLLDSSLLFSIAKEMQTKLTAIESSDSAVAFLNDFLPRYSKEMTEESKLTILTSITQPGKRFYTFVEELGPLVQKFLQIFIEDVRDYSMRMSLSKLRTQINPIPRSFYQTQLASLLSQTHFQFKRPLGSATIAGACLLENNEQNAHIVAKIPRQKIEKSIRLDKARISKVLKDDPYALSFIRSLLNEVEEELDTTHEFLGLLYNHQSYKDFPHIHTILPYNIPDSLESELGANRVLLMEKANGMALSDIGDPSIKVQALHWFYLAWSKNALLENGFYHGDPHLGNLLYDKQTQKVTPIDLGNYNFLNRTERVTTLKLIKATFDNDPLAMLKQIKKVALLQTPTQIENWNHFYSDFKLRVLDSDNPMFLLKQMLFQHQVKLITPLNGFLKAQITLQTQMDALWASMQRLKLWFQLRQTNSIVTVPLLDFQSAQSSDLISLLNTIGKETLLTLSKKYPDFLGHTLIKILRSRTSGNSLSEQEQMLLPAIENDFESYSADTIYKFNFGRIFKNLSEAQVDFILENPDLISDIKQLYQLSGGHKVYNTGEFAMHCISYEEHKKELLASFPKTKAVKNYLKFWAKTPPKRTSKALNLKL